MTRASAVLLRAGWRPLGAAPGRAAIRSHPAGAARSGRILRQRVRRLRRRRRPRSVRRLQRHAQPALSERRRHVRRRRGGRRRRGRAADARGGVGRLRRRRRSGSAPRVHAGRRRRCSVCIATTADASPTSRRRRASPSTRAPCASRRGSTSMATAISISSSPSAIEPNALFRNDGGRFTDIAATLGLADPRKSVGAVWFDFDEDGDLDLYVAQHGRRRQRPLRNDGGTFTDVADVRGTRVGRPRAARRGQRHRAAVRGRRRRRWPLRSRSRPTTARTACS